ncbi:helix-turn-helix transcriptional regulator [Cereibacter sphaeroides]|uniref:helix-turn-helix transcriptional regulator n=1 Tax=Cereibacter sphaeroides TaxID=1063 RepID=UPI0002A3DE26|nr:helix-turn-helix transcriptional regulator [Cereibacter sphaeroides]EKX59131.1 transcriptional regulator, ArsR family [Rhodobacter sp. AKP1]RIA00692.1 transcriptional regulator [Cereibacter sphaeroides]
MDPTVLSAIAAPTRPLADGSDHRVCELMRKLGATRSRPSRHMQVRKQAGLVVDRRAVVRYRIRPALPPALSRLLGAAMAAEKIPA